MHNHKVRSGKSQSMQALQHSKQKENVMLELELLPVKINHPLAQRLSLPIFFNYTHTFTYLLRGNFPHQYTFSAWHQ